MEKRNDRLVPFRAIPPGETLKEELRERGIKQKDFAKTIGMSPSHLNELIKGKIRLTPSIADKLEGALGIDAIIWVNMQAGYEYDLKATAEKKNEEESAIEFERKCAEVLNIKNIYRRLDIADMPRIERVRKVKSVLRRLAYP